MPEVKRAVKAGAHALGDPAAIKGGPSLPDIELWLFPLFPLRTWAQLLV